MNTVRKLSARSNEHFLRVVGQAAQSTRQVEIARSTGLSETTVSRLLRTQEAREAVDVLRAQALTKSWEAFSGLLSDSIDYLRGAMKSPLVGHQTRARVAVKLLELGLLAGAIPQDEERLNLVIVPPTPSTDEKGLASGYVGSINDPDPHEGNRLASNNTNLLPTDMGDVFLTTAQEVLHDDKEVESNQTG